MPEPLKSKLLELAPGPVGGAIVQHDLLWMSGNGERVSALQIWHPIPSAPPPNIASAICSILTAKGLHRPIQLQVSS